MAQNVVIDIDARTKNFESALDSLTAKVRSTANEMDKIFASGATNAVNGTNKAVLDLGVNLKNISVIAAGEIIAKQFQNATNKVKEFGKQVFNQMENMQDTEMKLQSIVATEMVKTGKAADYQSAMAAAEKVKNELMAWFKEISLISPYQYKEVINSFMTNANLGGQDIETTKKITKAILELGSGLGMTEDAMKRFSMALAQTGATGRITQGDLNQFANAGFGRDKMFAVFDKINEKYGTTIQSHLDFNKAIKEGQIEASAFYEALSEYASQNYGGSVEAMASTIGGLKSSWGDIKDNALNDLFLEASKTISHTLKPYIEWLMEMLTSGEISSLGQKINTWVQKAIVPFQKFGAELENGNAMRAVKSLTNYLTGSSKNLGAVYTLLKRLGGEEFADEWITKIQKLKSIIDSVIAKKDTIIAAIKGVGTALATALTVNTITRLAKAILSLNNPVTWLSAAGALIGVAWQKNLFHIQEHVQSLKKYVTDLYKVFKQKGWTGVWDNILNSWDKNKILSNIIKADELKNFGQRMKTMFTDLFDFNIERNQIAKYISDIVSVFKEGGISGVFQKLQTDIQTAVDKIVAYKDKIVAAYQNGGISGVFRTIGEDIRKHFTDSLKNSYETTKGFFEIWTTGLFGEEAGNKLKNVFSEIEKYFEDLNKIFKTDGLAGVFDKITTDLSTQIELHHDEWVEAIKQGGLNLVGILFGEDTKKDAEKTVKQVETYVEGLQTAFNEGGISGVFEKITTDIQQYVQEHRGEWIQAVRDGGFNVIGVLFGEDTKQDAEQTVAEVESYAQKIRGAFEKGGLASVFETITGDLNKYLEEHQGELFTNAGNGIIDITQFLFGSDVSESVSTFIGELNTAFEEGGWSSVGETIGKKIRDGIINWLAGSDNGEVAENISKLFDEGNNAEAFSGIGELLSKRLLEGIKGLSTALGDEEFTTNLQNAFDDGGLLEVGRKIGERIRDGVRETLTNLIGAEDAESIVSGLELFDNELFKNISEAFDSLRTTIQDVNKKVQEIVDEDTWTNAQKTFGLIAGFVAIIVDSVTAMTAPAIEGVGDSIVDFTNFVDKLLAFFGKIFEIFQDLYTGDFAELNADAGDLGNITQRLVESVILFTENILMTIMDMIVTGIASIVPGGDSFLGNTWKPAINDYRSQMQDKRIYGAANVDLANIDLGVWLANNKHGSYSELEAQFGEREYWPYMQKRVDELCEQGKINSEYFKRELSQEEINLKYREQYESTEHNGTFWDYLNPEKVIQWMKENNGDFALDYGNKELWDYAYDGLYSSAEKLVDVTASLEQQTTELVESTSSEPTWIDSFVEGFDAWFKENDFTGTLQDYVNELNLTDEQYELVRLWGQAQYEQQQDLLNRTGNAPELDVFAPLEQAAKEAAVVVTETADTISRINKENVLPDPDDLMNLNKSQEGMINTNELMTDAQDSATQTLNEGTEALQTFTLSVTEASGAVSATEYTDSGKVVSGGTYTQSAPVAMMNNQLQQEVEIAVEEYGQSLAEMPKQLTEKAKSGFSPETVLNGTIFDSKFSLGKNAEFDNVIKQKEEELLDTLETAPQTYRNEVRKEANRTVEAVSDIADTFVRTAKNIDQLPNDVSAEPGWWDYKYSSHLGTDPNKLYDEIQTKTKSFITDELPKILSNIDSSENAKGEFYGEHLTKLIENLNTYITGKDANGNNFVYGEGVDPNNLIISTLTMLPGEIGEAFKVAFNNSEIVENGLAKEWAAKVVDQWQKVDPFSGSSAAAGLQLSEKWIARAQELINKKDKYTGLDGTQYADLMISAVERMGLPQEIQDSMIQALSTTGVTKDFVAEYVGYMITAIQENGIGTNGEYALPSYKENWDADFQSAWMGAYSDYLSDFTYAIYKEMRDNAETYAGMESDAAKLLAAENIGHGEQQYYDSLSQYHNLLDTLGPVLQNTMDAVGLNMDTFQHVSIDNFADAKEYIGSFSEFDELYEQFSTGMITDNETIASLMESIMTTLAGDEEAKLLSDILRANTDPKWTKTFMDLLHGEIKDFESKFGDALGKIKDQTEDMGGKTSSYGKNNADIDIVKGLYQNYNTATGDLKTYYQDMIQGYVESTLNGTGSTWAGVSVDMLNKDIDLWNNWIRDLSMYGTSTAEGWTVEDRQMYNWGTHLQQAKDYEEQMLARQKEMEELKVLDPEKYAEMMKENKNQGLLGMLFGEDFDLSELFAQGLEGLSDFLNEDTIASIQSLFNIELDSEKASSWHKMATALSVLGTAMESLKTAVGGEDGFLQNLTTDLKDLTDIEIAEDTINNLKEFSNALNNLGTALQFIASALGNNASGALEGAIASGIDPNTMVSDSGGLLGSLKEIANMQFDENAIANWKLFSDALNGISNALMNINGYIGLLDFSQFKEAQSPTALIDGWNSLAGAISAVSNGLLNINSVIGLFDLTNFADTKAPEEFIQGWNDLSGAVNGVSNALMNINNTDGLLSILDMSNFGNIELPQAFLDAWTKLAGDVKTVADNLDIIQEIFGKLFGTGEEGGTPFAGMMGVGGSSTTYQITGMGEEGEGGGNGLFGMLFGSMDAETLAIVAQMLTPELLAAFMTLLTTQIDTQVIDSWTLLSDQISRTSQAIVDMMVALTNGEEGELGEETAGASLVKALYDIGVAAETIAPQVEVLNPVLEKMGEYLQIILTNLTKICDVMRYTFAQAVKAFLPLAIIAMGVLQSLASEAASAGGHWAALAASIWAAVHALQAWNGLQEGNNKGGGGVKFAAGGTSGFRYGTAIVGEHGPELITNNGSRAWTVFSNNTLMDEIARTKYALNVLSNSAEYFAYNRLAGNSGENSGTTDNSQNFTNNFNGNIVGDDAFREMIEDTVREVWRREMNLAN